MKKYINYCLFGLILLMFFFGCKKEQPFYYDSSQNGVYFNYDNEAEFKTEINFANHVLGNPTEVPIKLELKVLGYFSDNTRKAVLKSKPIEGYSLADVVLPDVVFEADEVEKEIEIQINRPAERDKDFAVCIYLDAADSQSQFGEGIAGKEEFQVYVKETYKQPDAWAAMGPMYLGPWTPDKHIFLINLSKDNNYTAKLYDYYSVVNFNKAAVDSLRTWSAAHPGEKVTLDFPFVSDNQYDKPFYWGEMHNEYLGEYSSNLFSALCESLGADTSNEEEKLSGDESKIKELNKVLVKKMMSNYNMYFSSWGLQCSNYKDQFWVPMFNDVDYEVVQPDAWNPNSQGGAEKTNHYYGEYSVEKYKFMIETLLEKDGTENFVLVNMFPLKFDYATMSAVWDDSIGGESKIQECYKLFKDAYSSQPGGTYNFTFPELDI